ncbi:hypothetical protein [Streptomyces sp. NPDC021622]|uniref:hypothetical protein n=1 Tax=Streptomyces sp. NPDC021622 TaxID=3155013 RepID=UPI003400446B
MLAAEVQDADNSHSDDRGWGSLPTGVESRGESRPLEATEHVTEEEHEGSEMPQFYDPPDGHGTPDWLTLAVLDVVTHYCQPRETVLLLTADADDPHHNQSGPLGKAAESASGLGRPVAVRTVLPVRRPPGRSLGPTTVQSGPGPTPWPPAPHTVAHRTLKDRAESIESDPERFDMVIACVDARLTDWIDQVPWNTLLSTAGLLAFITHSHAAGSCSTTIPGFLAPAALRAGLIQLEQVTLRGVPRHIHASLSLFIRPLPAVRAVGH